MTTRKRIFLILFFAIQLGLIWPVYPIFGGIYPMILGLPLSFAWIILMLLSGFALLLWYHLSEPNPNHQQPQTKTPEN